MPTPRWSILFRRIQCDPQSVSLAGRCHRGRAGRPGLVDRPVAGRDLGPDLDGGGADLDPAGRGFLPSRAKVGFPILPPPLRAGAGGGGRADPGAATAPPVVVPEADLGSPRVGPTEVRARPGGGGGRDVADPPAAAAHALRRRPYAAAPAAPRQAQSA